MKKLFISLLTIMVMVSCSESGGIDDNGGDNNQGGENVHTTPTITLDKSSVTFDEYADEEVVSFFSSVVRTGNICYNNYYADWEGCYGIFKGKTFVFAGYGWHHLSG